MREGLLPFRQLGLRHSLEEFRPDGHNALEGAKLAVCRRDMDGSETRNRSPAACNDDLPAGLDPRKSLERLVFAACTVTVDMRRPRLSPAP